MCDTRLKNYSDWGPFEQTKGTQADDGGEVPMTEQKKGIFFRLFGQQQKSGGCCNMKIEEITEEDEGKAPPQGRPGRTGSSYCGPASQTPEEHESRS